MHNYSHLTKECCDSELIKYFTKSLKSVDIWIIKKFYIQHIVAMAENVQYNLEHFKQKLLKENNSMP